MKEAFSTVKHYILLDPEDTLQENELLFDAITEDGKKLMSENPSALEERMNAVTSDCWPTFY